MGEGSLAVSVYFSLQFGDVFFHAAFFQQVVAWSLLAANGTAELGDKKAGANRLGEGPASGLAPFAGQSGILVLDGADVTGNLNGNPLARQRGGKIVAERFAIAIELDQRLEMGKGVLDLGAIIFALQAVANPATAERPFHPQAVGAVAM